MLKKHETVHHHHLTFDIMPQCQTLAPYHQISPSMLQTITDWIEEPRVATSSPSSRRELDKNWFSGNVFPSSLTYDVNPEPRVATSSPSLMRDIVPDARNLFGGNVFHSCSTPYDFNPEPSIKPNSSSLGSYLHMMWLWIVHPKNE